VVSSLHPPLDFSLVGLRGSSGARWVEFFDGEVGKPVWSVTLAHHADPALVLVTTAPRERWDQRMAGGGESGEVEFASNLVRVLLDLARAEFEGSERGQYNRALWPFAQEQGKVWESWEHAQWSVDGQTMPARTWRFAHGWTGLTLGVPGNYVGVTAFDSEDHEADLVGVSGSEYGFDFAIPFTIHGLELQRPGRTDTTEIYRSQSRHPDHDRVLAFLGPPSS